MKKVFLLLLITFSASAYSQFSVGMHTGISKNRILAGLHSQYQFRNGFTTGVNMTAHVDQSNPVFFQSRFGYTIGNTEKLTVQPYMGYSYRIQSADQKDFGGHFTAGVQMRYQLTDIALIYSDLNIPSPKYFMFSIGLAGRLPR